MMERKITMTVVAPPEKVTTPRGVLLSMSYFTNREAAALALASVKAYKVFAWRYLPW